MTSWALESSMPMAIPGNPSAKSRGKLQEKLLISPITLSTLLYGNCSCDPGGQLLVPTNKELPSSTPLTNTLFRPHFQTSEFKDAALINKHVDGLLVLIDKHIATKPETPLEVQVSIHPMFLSHNDPQHCSTMPNASPSNHFPYSQ